MNPFKLYADAIGVRAGDREVRRTVPNPKFIAPMLCKDVQQLPGPADYFYEVKYDGYRTIVIKRGSSIAILSRSGQPLDYPEAREAVRRLKARSAVIDCELVALVDGKPSIEALTGANGSRDIRLYVFDLLYLNGHNLVEQPIERRKEWLCTATIDSAMLFSPALNCAPAFLIEQVRRLRLSGIVAKRRASRYEPGERTGTWVKMSVNAKSEMNGRIGSWRRNPNLILDWRVQRMGSPRSGLGEVAVVPNSSG